MRNVLLAVVLGLSTVSAAAQEAPQQLGVYQFAYPFPSPDGARLAFQSNVDGRWQLYEMTLETGAVRRLHVSSRDDTHAAYAPDGRSLAFTSTRDGNADIYVLDLESGQARSLAPHPGLDGHPKFSADGQWIVFNRALDADDLGGERDAAIVRVRTDGSHYAVISDNANLETFASFSRDGRSVVIVEWVPIAGAAPSGDIVVIDIASGRRRNLTNSPEFDGYPFWGFSGEWIYFSTFIGAGPTREAILRRVRARDGRIEDLTTRDGVGEVRAIPNPAETELYYNIYNPPGGRVELFRRGIAPAS